MCSSDLVLVKFSSRFSFSSNQGHLKNRYQAKAAQKLSNDGLVHVKIREGQSVEDAIQELSRDPSVEFVEPAM